MTGESALKVCVRELGAVAEGIEVRSAVCASGEACALAELAGRECIVAEADECRCWLAEMEVLSAPALFSGPSLTRRLFAPFKVPFGAGVV